MLLHAGEAASTTSRRSAPHAAAPSQAVPERDTALSLFPSDVDALLAQLTALSRGLIELQERERQAIARELHDEIGQCLSAIRVQFAQLQRRATDASQRAMIQSAASMTEQTLGRVRSLSLLLHPPQLETLGLEAALSWHLHEQRQRHDIDIAFRCAGLPRDIHPDVAIAAYRIVQESVGNALRHGHPSRIKVDAIGNASALLLEIVDDGIGLPVPPSDAHRQPTLGLIGMAERARLLGGDIGVFSRPAEGVRIAARLPWR